MLNVALADTDRTLFCVVPHTTSLRGSQFEVAVPVSFLNPGAFLMQDITNFSVSRFDRRLGTLNSSQMHMLEDGLRLLFAL